MGNIRTLFTADIAVAGFPTQLAVTTVFPPDATAPILTSFSFTPTTVDTTSGPVTIALNFSVTDDLVGATAFYVKFQSPSGEYRDNITSFAAATAMTGSLSFPFPQYSEAGSGRSVRFGSMTHWATSGRCLRRQSQIWDFPLTEVTVATLPAGPPGPQGPAGPTRAAGASRSYRAAGASRSYRAAGTAGAPGPEWGRPALRGLPGVRPGTPSYPSSNRPTWFRSSVRIPHFVSHAFKRSSRLHRRGAVSMR